MAKSTNVTTIDLPTKLKTLLEVGRKSELSYSSYVLKADKKPLTSAQKMRMHVLAKRIGEVIKDINTYVKAQGYSIKELDLILISGEYIKIASSGSYKTIYVLR